IHQLIPMSALADYLGVSPMGLQRLFKRHTGDSPGSVFHKMRMQAAQERLKKGDESVKAVGLSFGYRHAGDFTRAYKAFFGINASER
ncbi:helix-turn-helix transcriptional regulator, partial [Arthrospira platensis SPKY1]|nr:helix-turn-helix transcriptional regulator [Arthrospira platensis SPKY1]